VTRIFQDDLPSIGVSRLRATDAITADMTSVKIEVGGELAEVGLYLQKFPNGGSWSFFLCPQCGHKARTLRLYEGRLLCKICLVARGVRRRCEPTSVKKRAEMRISKLGAMLQSEVSLRLKPHLWGKMERRSRLRAALERAEYVVKRSEFKRQVKEEGDVAVHSKVSAWLRSSRSQGG
jgi:uncharacterized Zn finger protein (UPF0148 family)